jgi:hypothetical protein
MWKNCRKTCKCFYKSKRKFLNQFINCAKNLSNIYMTIIYDPIKTIAVLMMMTMNKLKSDFALMKKHYGHNNWLKKTTAQRQKCVKVIRQN